MKRETEAGKKERKLDETQRETQCIIVYFATVAVHGPFRPPSSFATLQHAADQFFFKLSVSLVDISESFESKGRIDTQIF